MKCCESFPPCPQAANTFEIHHYLQSAAVLGTHTHVPTLDAKVLPGGTAYVTDIGMTGPYDGVIGMKKECSLGRFLNVQRPRYEVATGDAQLHAVLITTDGRQAVSIERILRTL